MPVLTTEEKIIAIQDLFCRFGSMAIGNGTFTMDKFLKYKPLIRKTSNVEALKKIGKELMEEITA